MALSKQYIAGFIDGEGSIGINENTAYKARTANRRPRVVARITISNCVISVLKKIQKQYGGSLYQHPTHYNPNARDSFRLVISEQSAAKFAKDILPYLQIKKKQAKMLISLMKRKKIDRPYITEAESDYRLSLVEKCRELNRRGPR